MNEIGNSKCKEITDIARNMIKNVCSRHQHFKVLDIYTSPIKYFFTLQ